jgi:hypothetical protein
MKKSIAALASRLRCRLEGCQSKNIPPWAPQIASLALRLLLIIAAEQKARIESPEGSHHTQEAGAEQMHPEEGEGEERF